MDKLVFLPLRIDRHRLAFPIEQVVGVQAALVPVELPGAPFGVVGVVNVRGALLPVVQLAAVLGFRVPAQGLWQPWLRLRSSRRELFVPVDEVETVMSMAPEAFVPAEDPQLDSGRLAGVVRLRDGLVLIQDVERLLDAAAEASLDAAMSEYDA